MIGRLQGVLLEKQPPEILLDVHGVGYELLLPMTSFYDLPEIGKETTLFTHLVVREDAHLLFGFAQKNDRTLFRELIRLNGVGPKLALALMSGMSVDEMIQCVNAEDTSRLMKVPGVGKKTAERLLVELKDRFKNWDSTPLAGQNSLEPAGLSVVTDAHSPEKDAVSALISLGFKPAEASRAVSAVAQDGLSSEDLIRRALKGMA